MPKLLSICVTHQQPLIPKAWYDFELALGSYNESSDYHISNLDAYWHSRRDLSFGAAGSYAIPMLFKKLEVANDCLVRLTSFRKAIVRNPRLTDYGVVAGNGAMDLACANDTGLAMLEPAAGCAFLVNRPILLDLGVVGQYAAAHVAVDLVNYLSLAIDMKILNNASVENFLRTKYFIAGGGEIGVFPAGWTADLLTKLGFLGREFLDKYDSRIRSYNSYQVRSIGFLSERLASFFVLKELKMRYPAGIPGKLFGTLVTISEDGLYQPGKA